MINQSRSLKPPYTFCKHEHCTQSSKLHMPFTLRGVATNNDFPFCDASLVLRLTLQGSC